MRRCAYLALLFFVIVPFSKSSSQSIEWEKTYGDSLNAEYCEAITVCPNGGYFLLGRTTGPLISGNDLYIIRTNESGDTLWSRRYGEPNREEIGYDVCSTYDNGFMICGSATCGDNCSGTFLMRLDSLGDSLWTRRYGGLFGGQGQSLVQTADSGFAIAGIVRESSPSDIKGALLRIDKNGDSLWSIYFGSSPEFVVLEDVTLFQNGDLLVSGGRNNDNTQTHDIFVARLDSDGNLIWDNFYGSASYQKSLASTILSDSSIIVAGFQLTQSQWFEYMLLHLETNGDSLSATVFGDANYQVCVDVVSTSDSGFAFVGNSSIFSPPRYFGISLRKYAGPLSPDWDLMIDSTYELNSSSIQKTLDGGFIIGGYKEAQGGGQPLDMWVAKIQGPPCCQGIRGDVNGDGPDANILDLNHLVNYIFRGSGYFGPCPEESDVNGDVRVANIIDLNYLVNVIFRGGPIPPPCAK